ncbi:hypothetical protein [Paenibacillus sp. CF384]|uniref:hypothetical protein n=1 Tax=Paenibacillus sp. CF384 TaxID=1884382 RepID=UPI00089A5FE4|nr:hypothetical protein [Paenibacillus sp. CF384]SDX06166.1 hypothetical protein SAMN05518855_1008110 [Paenibacillus sp. CF384]
MKPIKILILFVSVITGIFSFTQGAMATSYPSAVSWNNFVYGLSIEEIDVKDIGNQIGRIERLRTPMPKKNGESNDTPVGSLLFEIKGVDTHDEIAVKVDDKYYKASPNGPLPVTEDTISTSKVITLSAVSFLGVCLTLIIIWRRKRRRIG